MSASGPQKPPIPARVLAYCRVSSDAQEREGTSLEAQQEILVAECKARDWPAPELFIEVESGGELARERRVELARLERLAAKGDVILTCHVDRWSRDIVYTVDSVRKLVRRGVRWEATEDGIDATTDRGMAWLIDRAADAEKERARIRARTVGTRQRLRRAGFHVEGNPLLGFRVESRKLVPGDKAPVARRMFELALDDLSVRDISAALLEEFPGTPGIDPGAIARRLRDRRYIGESCSEGKGQGEWRVTHEPIIDKATWGRAQAALDARRLGGRRPGVDSRTSGHLLRGGLLLCAHCGRIMSCHVPKDGASVTHGGYYVCRRRTESARGNACDRGPIARYRDVDDEVSEAVVDRLEQLALALARPPKRSPPRPQIDRSAERAKLAARLGRLVDAVAEGVLTGATAKEKIGTIEAAIRRIDDIQLVEEPPPVNRSTMLVQVKALRRSWARLGIPERRAALRLLAEKIEIESTTKRRWKRGAWRLRITWRELAK